MPMSMAIIAYAGIPDQTIMGQPYHTLVPGYKTKTVNMLRLVERPRHARIRLAAL